MQVEMAGCSLSGCDTQTRYPSPVRIRARKTNPVPGYIPARGSMDRAPVQPESRTRSELPDQNGAFSEGLMRIIRDLDGTPALLKANTW